MKKEFNNMRNIHENYEFTQVAIDKLKITEFLN